jgi:hypothetical protein
MSNNTPVRTYLPTVTNAMKWWLAIFLGVLAFLIFFTGTYNITNRVWIAAGLPTFLYGPGCPKAWGVVLQAILFVLLIRLILW